MLVANYGDDRVERQRAACEHGHGRLRPHFLICRFAVVACPAQLASKDVVGPHTRPYLPIGRRDVDPGLVGRPAESERLDERRRLDAFRNAEATVSQSPTEMRFGDI